MDGARTSPNLPRHLTLQKTPTFASLLCELRVQCPDLLEKEWEVGLVVSQIYAAGTVAAEFGDKVLAYRESRMIARIYSPFLAQEIFVVASEIMFATPFRAVRRATTTRAPRETVRKRMPKQTQKAAMA